MSDRAIQASPVWRETTPHTSSVIAPGVLQDALRESERNRVSGRFSGALAVMTVLYFAGQFIRTVL